MPDLHSEHFYLLNLLHVPCFPGAAAQLCLSSIKEPALHYFCCSLYWLHRHCYSATSSCSQLTNVAEMVKKRSLKRNLLLGLIREDSIGRCIPAEPKKGCLYIQKRVVCTDHSTPLRQTKVFVYINHNIVFSALVTSIGASVSQSR